MSNDVDTREVDRQHGVCPDCRGWAHEEPCVPGLQRQLAEACQLLGAACEQMQAAGIKALALTASPRAVKTGKESA